VEAIEVVLLSRELVEPPKLANHSDGLLFLFPIGLSLVVRAMDAALDAPGVFEPDFLLGISGGGVLNKVVKTRKIIEENGSWNLVKFQAR